MATLNRDRRGERGQAIVELALTLPLLLLVVLGVFDFGLMFQRFEVVTNAAREGARVGVLPDFTTTNAETHSGNYLTFGGVPATSIVHGTCPATGGLTPGRACTVVTEETITLSTTPPKTVKVMVSTVSYDHQHVFVGPIAQLFGGSFGTTRLRAVSKMRKEAS
ncbi:MAG: TadE/TadG family type IV pilus assembly protein [Vicinamibacterales bacterium]